MSRKLHPRSQAHQEPSPAQVFAGGLALFVILYGAIILAAVVLVRS